MVAKTTSAIHVNADGILVDDAGDPFALSSPLEASVVPRQNTFADLMALSVSVEDSGELCKPTDVDGCIIQLNHLSLGGNVAFYAGGTGADLAVSLDGLDMYNLPASIRRLNSITFTGTPSAPVTFALNSVVASGTFTLINNTTEAVTEDSSGAITLDGQARLFGLANNQFGTVVSSPIGDPWGL